MSTTCPRCGHAAEEGAAARTCPRCGFRVRGLPEVASPPGVEEHLEGDRLHLIVRRGVPWVPLHPRHPELVMPWILPLWLLVIPLADRMPFTNRDARFLAALMVATVSVAALALVLGRVRTHVVLEDRTLTAWELPFLAPRRLEKVCDVQGADGVEAFSRTWPHRMHVVRVHDDDIEEHVVRRLREHLVRVARRSQEGPRSRPPGRSAAA
jgi:hypothetical protein